MSKLSTMIEAAPKGAMLVCTKANKAMAQELCRMMGREDLTLQVADEGPFGGNSLKNVEVDSIPRGSVKRSCNAHDDCDDADAAVLKALGPGHTACHCIGECEICTSRLLSEDELT